jgi:hypothetical protein
MIKMDNYRFQEYAKMRLILGEACGKGAAAVRLYPECYLSTDFWNPACSMLLIVASRRLVLFTLLHETLEDKEIHE